MKRCGYCKQIVWRILPWQHYAFQTMEGGTEFFHVACYQEMNLELTYTETQRQYSTELYKDWLTSDKHQRYSYEDFLARLEDEDGGW